jgi:hypothetical protein
VYSWNDFIINSLRRNAPCGGVLLAGLDEFYARAAPARGFDQIDPDFNTGLFGALLAGVTVATIALQRLSHAKEVRSAWN